MGKHISLYDEEGNLKSLAVLGKELADDHAGIAPIGLLNDLRERHAEAAKLGLGKNVEEGTERMGELVDKLFKEKGL